MSETFLARGAKQIVQLSWKVRYHSQIIRTASTTAVTPSQKKSERPLDLKEFDTSRIRNFSIIAHIDHGKSTLADGLLELSGTIEKNAENAQVLDKLPVERERGITVKAQTASMFHKYNGKVYLLNLIDTPGHVDFSYEVSRSLAACDGAVLLVDANKGVQAQTVANFWLAFEHDLTVVGVVNKIDVPNARPDVAVEQMRRLFDLDPTSTLRISAKLRTGIDKVMDEIVERVKPPVGDRDKPLKAFMFDSWYATYKGCYALVLIKDGVVSKGREIVSLQTGKKYEVQEVGVMHPEPKPVDALYAGQVGYILANIRNVQDALIGDTFCSPDQRSLVQPMPGFKKLKPVVFAGVFPLDNDDYESVKSAIEKLSLNDPSVQLDVQNSAALGPGWRVGFLGVLHMEVFVQRLEQEYGVDVILTAPNVSYVAKLVDDPSVRKLYDEKSELIINDPSKYPETRRHVETFLEPMASCTIITPLEYYRAVENLCRERGGEQTEATMITDDRMLFKYRFALADIIIDFFSTLKELTNGYASFDYDFDDYRPADIVKVDILLNGKCVNEFSVVTTRDQARERGKFLCQRLSEELHRQLFQIVIQASIGKKILAREVLRPNAKDFGKTKMKSNYDRGRLAKLVKYQKQGQERLKLICDVQVPKEAFLNVMRRK